MGDKLDLFQKFLITENAHIGISDFLINSVIIVILAFLWEFTYKNCAKSLSNRSLFAANFMLLAFTTMVIISVVKASLALSLGLVGALSIIRFRTAVKEPEELAYLFFTIAIGIGLGANQRLVVLTAFGVICALVWLRYKFTKHEDNQNLFFTIVCEEPKILPLNTVVEIMKNHFSTIELKRFDENVGTLEISFLIESESSNNLQNCKEELMKKSEKIKVTFIDNKSY